MTSVITHRPTSQTLGGAADILDLHSLSIQTAVIVATLVVIDLLELGKHPGAENDARPGWLLRLGGIEHDRGLQLGPDFPGGYRAVSGRR